MPKLAYTVCEEIAPGTIGEQLLPPLHHYCNDRMLLDLKEQEIVRRRKIRDAGWGRAGSFSCAKAS